MSNWGQRFEPPYWWDEAYCLDDDYAHSQLFHPSEEAQKAAAEMYCGPCPVRSECLADALKVPVSWDWGVWGGTLRSDRHAIRRGKKTAVNEQK